MKYLIKLKSPNDFVPTHEYRQYRDGLKMKLLELGFINIVASNIGNFGSKNISNIMFEAEMEYVDQMVKLDETLTFFQLQGDICPFVITPFQSHFDD